LASIRALRADLDRGVRINEPLPQVRRTPQLYGALAAAASIGLCVGVYESCWSLLMRRYGASTLEIRLSWTFFSIPWVLLSPVGGWLADHGNRKWIAFFGTLNAALFLALYPQIHNVLILLALGPLESIGGALSVPSTSSLLSQGATVREMGRRQGLSTSANTAALAASAAAAGTLFSVDPVLPFVVMASISGSVTLTLLWFWRHVQGRVTPEPTSSELAAPS
jgi:MFS family permease